MDVYLRRPESAVPGALLRIHGSSTHAYSSLQECALMCSANIDCAGFVDNRVDKPTACVFKGSATDIQPRSNKDLYVKQGTYAPARLDLMQKNLLHGSHHTTSHVPPRIFAVDGFISADEAEALREAGRVCFESQRSNPGQEDYERRIPAHIMSSTYFGDDHSCAAGRAGPLLSKVEHRIGSLVGIPSHSSENPLMITRSSSHRGRYRVRNVHHDKNNAPHRSVTVLIYLNNLTEAQGGHTIFPGLLNDQSSSSSSESQADEVSRARLTKLADGMANAFEHGKVLFDGAPELTAARIAAAGHGTKYFRDDDLEREVLELTERQCERATQGANVALAVQPRLGTALVFHSDLPDGMADPRMWHAVCHHRGGKADRWAVQKFKSPRVSSGQIEPPVQFLGQPRGDAGNGSELVKPTARAEEGGADSSPGPVEEPARTDACDALPRARPVLALVVGLDGSGHQIFHSHDEEERSIFFEVQAKAPGNVRYLQPSQREDPRVPISRVASLFARTAQKLDEHDSHPFQRRADTIAALRTSIQEELVTTNSITNWSYLLEACPFPCYRQTAAYYSPDLAALVEAASDLVDVRALVLHRDMHDVLSSTVTKRTVTPFREQVHALSGALMEMNHAISRLPLSAVRHVRYEALVGGLKRKSAEARCWYALGDFWGIRDGLLETVAMQRVRDTRSGSKQRDRAAWSKEEAGFIDDLFTSEYALSRWPHVHAGLDTQPLC